MKTEFWDELTGRDYIRWKTAKRADLTRDAFITLATDAEWFVRLSMVLNPLCPDDILKDATTDPNRRVREFAQDMIARRTRA